MAKPPIGFKSKPEPPKLKPKRNDSCERPKSWPRPHVGRTRAGARPKVFGIGLHKTGTTSLYEAMKMLGYTPAAHYLTEHEYANIERYAFANDMPIDLRYPRLHAKFPDAKFILTVRDREAWVESLARHIAHAKRANNARYNQDHRAAYGEDYPEEPLLTQRYDQHYREVFEYFSRQEELGNFDFKTQFLQLDLCAMDSENAWFELCMFLDISPGPFIMGPSFPCKNVGVGK